MKYKIEKHWITESRLEALVLLYYYGEDNKFKSHRCGYVAIDKNHPLYGIKYDEECDLIKQVPSVIFNVHGGLTYSGSGRLMNDDFWWFGFDCVHSGDARIDDIYDQNKFSGYGAIVRTREYVEKECESLAQQLINFQKEVEIENTQYQIY